MFTYPPPRFCALACAGALGGLAIGSILTSAGAGTDDVMLVMNLGTMLGASTPVLTTLMNTVGLGLYEFAKYQQETLLRIKNEQPTHSDLAGRLAYVRQGGKIYPGVVRWSRVNDNGTPEVSITYGENPKFGLMADGNWGIYFDQNDIAGTLNQENLQGQEQVIGEGTKELVKDPLRSFAILNEQEMNHLINVNQQWMPIS